MTARVTKKQAIRRARRMRVLLSQIVRELETPGAHAVGYLGRDVVHEAEALQAELVTLSQQERPS